MLNREKKEGVTIGWYGSMVHVGDIPLVSMAIASVMRQRPSVRFATNGNFTKEHWAALCEEFGDRVIIDGWMDPMRLYSGIARYDISLAPLSDHAFNRCKSNIKWIEAAASEVPTVATPLDPYSMGKDGEDIVFASNSAEWETKLLELVDNPDLRRRIALSARVRVGREYDNKVVAEHWLKAFRSVLGWR